MLTIASTIHATRPGRSPPTDRARREPASHRSGTGAGSDARFSREAIARATEPPATSCLCGSSATPALFTCSHVTWAPALLGRVLAGGRRSLTVRSGSHLIREAQTLGESAPAGRPTRE